MPPMSASPETIATWSAIVAMTGCGVSRIELGRAGAVEAGQVPRGLDHHALQAEAQAERRDAALAGVPQRAELALDAADTEPAGDDDRVDPGQRGRGPGGRLAGVGRDPADRHVRPVGERRPRAAPRTPTGTRRAGRCTCRRARPSPRRAGGAPGRAGRPTPSSRRRGTAGRAGARHRRRAPRRAAPSGSRRCSARRRRPPRPRRRRRTSARSCA